MYSHIFEWLSIYIYVLYFSCITFLYSSYLDIFEGFKRSQITCIWLDYETYVNIRTVWIGLGSCGTLSCYLQVYIY